ncbi:MAG: helix-turn-helix transcriptional regulator [Candidatus Thorarchaeota archaeon]
MFDVEVTDLLFEISSEERLRILHLLDDEPKKLSDIARILDITTSETSRHLSRLGDKGAIEKNNNGEYCLNGYGKLLIQMTSYFEFLVDKKEYIQTHDLSVLPSRFITQLGDLKDSMVINGVYQVMDLQMTTVKESNKRIWILSPESYREIGPVFREKIASGVDVRIILDEKAVETDELADMPRKQYRILSNVPVLIGVFDGGGGVCFPDKSGKVDLSVMISGISEEFISWISEVFQYYWNMTVYLAE